MEIPQPIESNEDVVPTGILERLRAAMERRKPAEPRKRRIHVIINPAAGKDQPILKALNQVMQAAEMEWEVFITKQAGDGRQFAQEAAQAGVDVVAVHGGDGTVMEAASGLMGSQVPLAIIPGGTANVMSLELGIPTGLMESCALAVDPEAVVRTVDMGQVDDHYFLLRAGMGLEAAMVEGADREMKDRLGVMAYAFSALHAIANPPVARYRLDLDGLQVEVEGLTCLIANSGTMGPTRMKMAPTMDVSDGLLDVVVVTRTNLPALISMAASVVSGGEPAPALQHWQVRQVTVEADPPQNVQVDGEILGETPVSARVIPGAVRILVPPQAEAA